MWGLYATKSGLATPLAQSRAQYGAIRNEGPSSLEMQVLHADDMAPPQCLQVDLHRVSELLHVPQAALEARLDASVAHQPPGHPQFTYKCHDTQSTPIPFHPQAEDSDSSFGSWTGQSLLAALMGSPQELCTDPYFDTSTLGAHLAPAPFRRLDQFLVDPFPPSRPLPIASARVEVTDTTPEARVFLTVKFGEPMLAWIMLLIGIIGWSSAGPTYLLLPQRLQHRSLRISAWRYGGGFLPFALFTLWKWWRGPMRAEIQRHISDTQRWPQYVVLALSIFGGFVCYGLAVTYCQAMALAAGMSTVNPFLQLLWNRSVGKPLGSFQRASLCLAVVAVVIMVVADQLHSVHGIAWAVASAVCYVIYVQWSETLTEEIPFFLLMMVTFGIGAVLSILATMWFEGTTLRWGPESLFGFLESHHVFWVVVLLDFMFILGIVGLTGCLKHVPPLVVAVAISLEPAFAITMTVLEDEQGPPTPMMILGVATLFVASVLLGTVTTLQGKAEVKVDITEATTWRK